VQTLVPSGLVEGFPGEMRLPTSTTVLAFGLAQQDARRAVQLQRSV